MDKTYFLRIAKESADSFGKDEFIRFLNERKITIKEAVIAMCYQCSGYYFDGKVDCELQLCPLYPYMPYKGITTDPSMCLLNRRNQSTKNHHHK